MKENSDDEYSPFLPHRCFYSSVYVRTADIGQWSCALALCAAVLRVSIMRQTLIQFAIDG